MTPKILFEPCDVGRRLQVVPQTVKNLAKSGLLKITYVTPRGVRLFQPKDVERYAQERESKRQEF